MRDGGSAFPTTAERDPHIARFLAQHRNELGLSIFELQRAASIQPGMSLRDWFAGQVLTGEMGDQRWNDGTVKNLAQWAYMVADAMLDERNKSTEGK